MKLSSSVALLSTATALALANADEYFTGDGTAYTLGDTSSGNCNMMSALNFATTDYAALNNEQWSGLQNCGRCAEVSCADKRCADQTKSVVVQILDRCPECKHGDLDLSPSVFKTLTGSHPSRYTIKWKFVDCPMAGNVNYCLKGGSNNYWTAIQPTNVATGVTSLKINGKATKMLDGAYYYLLDGSGTAVADLSSVTVSLTDINGASMTDKLSLNAGSCTKGASQFPSSSGGSVPTTPTTTPSTNTSAPTTTPTQTPTPVTISPTMAPTQAPTMQPQTPSVATPPPMSSSPTPAATTASPTQQQEQPEQQEQQQSPYQNNQNGQWGSPYQNHQQWGWYGH
ncbi:hypothetical protein F442_10790 [Phytophthora nicotianae P10297]|uniref:Expansin-like EG45 domain-containing protein n=2 Tax=Phytophthora nicotianae TaxID=4792 RepID=W2Z5R8_PHYNI|nr:hypothetical protein F444_10945 [Phytophthora nicotianae P1976]ETP42296.1 hypothetical protein F442_10790 [Phytophthora nicotianae P10297]